MQNAGLDEAQAGINIARRHINNLRYTDDITLREEVEEEGSEKVGLKLNIQKTRIMAFSPITSWQIDGETMETVTDFIFLGSKITADSDCSHEIERCFLLERKAMTNLDSLLQSRDITNKGPSSQSCGFSSSHVWVWELDHKEGWVLKNWCFWTVVLEKTLESSLGLQGDPTNNPKGDQPWIFIGRTDAEAPILWRVMQIASSLEKTLMLGKIEGRSSRMTEEEMVGWHDWLNGREFEQIPGDGEGQGSLVCCSPCGRKESDTTEQLNWTKLYPLPVHFNFNKIEPSP